MSETTEDFTAEVWRTADRDLVRRVGIEAGHELAKRRVAHVSFGPGDMTRYDVAFVDLSALGCVVGDPGADYPERGLLVSCTNLDHHSFVVGWPRDDAPHWAYVAGKLPPQNDWTAVVLAEVVDALAEGFAREVDR